MIAPLALLFIAQAKSAATSEAPKIFHYVLSKDGNAIGTENYEYKVLPGKSADITIVIHISQFVVTANSTYTAEGIWKTKSLDIVGAKEIRSSATLTENGADVDAPGPNGRFKHILQPPDNISLNDPTIAWWRTTKPKLGDPVTFAYFDLEKVAWEPTVFTYMGDKSISLNGKTYATHHVLQKSGTDQTDYYMDDQGNPVVISGSTKAELTGFTLDTSK